MFDNIELKNENKREKKHNYESESKLVKVSDIVLIFVISAFSVLAIIYIMLTKETGERVEISVDGEVIKTLELSHDAEYQVTTEGGNNLIIIKDGSVDVIEANCPDKVCVNHVSIKNVGETIICLPHKLVIEIVD